MQQLAAPGRPQGLACLAAELGCRRAVGPGAGPKSGDFDAAAAAAAGPVAGERTPKLEGARSGGTGASAHQSKARAQ